MATQIAFLRAVNVAPRWMKMQRLRECLTGAGFTDVETHIQSGNIRFGTTMRSPTRIRESMEKLLAQEFGFATPVMLRNRRQLLEIVQVAEELPVPFTEGTDIRGRYVTLLAQEPSDAARETIDGWAIEGERLKVVGQEIHWWLGKSAHEAKISNTRLEKLVGMGTTRDLKVMRTLAEKWGKA